MSTSFNRYKRKPVTQKQRENMAHGQKMLEMAHARELLATWHWREDTPERRQWLRDALARTEKVYGPGAPERVRKYMRVIQDDNDSARNPENILQFQQIQNRAENS